jgi:hypothetical protein
LTSAPPPAPSSAPPPAPSSAPPPAPPLVATDTAPDAIGADVGDTLAGTVKEARRTSRLSELIAQKDEEDQTGSSSSYIGRADPGL